MKNLIRIVTICLFLVAILANQACMEQEVGDASLTVMVFGVLTGNAKDNVRVSIYRSRESADEEISEIASGRTGSDGKVTFPTLSAGRRYWVRANARILAHTIRETPRLDPGANFFEIGLP
ncbi:MAG: hypothetical protein AAFX87_03305 [Bacteroidota bacterium]